MTMPVAEIDVGASANLLSAQSSQTGARAAGRVSAVVRVDQDPHALSAARTIDEIGTAAAAFAAIRG